VKNSRKICEDDEGGGAGAVPAEIRRPIDYTEAKNALNSFADDSERQSEPLYICSFALSQTADHEHFGHLSLWDRYTQLTGYCLQYDAGEITSLLEKERRIRNYEILDLENIHYGIDDNDTRYRKLLFQMTQYILLEIVKRRPDLGIQLDYNKMAHFQDLAFELMRFISVHKDSFFEDERERRIIAVPAKTARPQFLIGPAWRKEIKKMPDGRRYIDIGADWPNALEPKRIIIGPKAPQDLSAVLPEFTRRPEVYIADFPIKA
jgi:hypothetical protein